MQNFVLKLAGLGLIMTVLFFTSCGDDPVVTNPLGPDIQFVSDPAFLSSDADVIIGTPFSVKIRLSKGDAQLTSLEVKEGTTKLATSRYTINGGAIVTNNPLLITGVDKDGVTYDINILPAATQTVGDITIYSFSVSDSNGATDLVDIAITTAAAPGTPITFDMSGVLFNQAGPAGTGGLDLDTGTGVGSANATADIRDLGIDCALPNTSNWRKQIGTVNGADMRKVDVSQLENFSFATVDKTEVILEAYTSGTALADGSSTTCGGATVAVTDVTAPVTVGDLFVVFANAKYYLIRVDEVNTTTNNNDDNYKLSIKY